MKKDRFIVTIDGPAGSGKSTISKLIAERDGFLHIDTGALYRAIGYLTDGHPAKNDLNNIHFNIRINNKIEIFYNGENIEKFIRNERCGMLASNVAKIDYVRDFVNKTARKIASVGKYIIDGRDCGSVIFPYADLKIFLDADLKERAKRRAFEDKRSVEEIEKEIEKRDKQDKSRNIAPLMKPNDAVVIDTTNLTIEDVYSKVKEMIKERYEHKDS